jgi:hypothetical protein
MKNQGQSKKPEDLSRWPRALGGKSKILASYETGYKMEYVYKTILSGEIRTVMTQTCK